MAGDKVFRRHMPQRHAAMDPAQAAKAAIMKWVSIFARGRVQRKIQELEDGNPLGFKRPCRYPGQVTIPARVKNAATVTARPPSRTTIRTFEEMSIGSPSRYCHITPRRQPSRVRTPEPGFR